MLTSAYFFEHRRGIPIKVCMINQTESGGCNVYGFCCIYLISMQHGKYPFYNENQDNSPASDTHGYYSLSHLTN